MPTIELFESTGAIEAQEVTTNKNHKSTGQPSSVAQYYLYPVRRPGDGSGVLLTSSFTNNLFAKVSGVYSKIRRPRWKIEVPNLAEGKIKLFYAMRDSYTKPHEAFDGSLTFLGAGTTYLFPRTGSVSPSTTTEYEYQYINNATFFTDYLVTQILVEQNDDDDERFLGNDGKEDGFENPLAEPYPLPDPIPLPIPDGELPLHIIITFEFDLYE